MEEIRPDVTSLPFPTGDATDFSDCLGTSDDRVRARTKIQFRDDGFDPPLPVVSKSLGFFALRRNKELNKFNYFEKKWRKKSENPKTRKSKYKKFKKKKSKKFKKKFLPRKE